MGTKIIIYSDGHSPFIENFLPQLLSRMTFTFKDSKDLICKIKTGEQITLGKEFRE